MSKLPNGCICLFYFQVGWGGYERYKQDISKDRKLYLRKKIVISDPLLYRHPLLLRQLKNNQNQTNTTGAQNFKEFNNTAGWLSP
jgi:hypothetical protein